eukprot:584665-Pyramimonas_sp.AAC.1
MATTWLVTACEGSVCVVRTRARSDVKRRWSTWASSSGMRRRGRRAGAPACASFELAGNVGPRVQGR